MFGNSSTLLLVGLLVAVGVGALALRLQWLLLAALLIHPIVPTATIIGWSVGPARVDASDLLFLATIAGLVLRAPPWSTGRKVPHLWLWILLGCAMSVSYLAAPVNQASLENSFAAPYLLVKYVWLPIVAFPLGALLLRDSSGAHRTSWALVLSALAFALSALPDIEISGDATGPFPSGNALGAALIPGTLAAASLLFVRETGRSWWFALGAFVVLVRTQMFTHSEGALAGLVAGLAIVGLRHARRPGAKRATQRVALTALVVAALAVITHPGILDRPNVREMMKLTEGTEHSNMRWRMQERWPFFIDKAKQRPWLGWGEDTDETFGRYGATPHSSYIALAVKYGVPVLVLYSLFLVTGLRNAYRLSRRTDDESEARLGVVAMSTIVALMLHGVVDGSLLMPYIQLVNFLLAGSVAVLLGSERARARATSDRAISGVPLPAGPS